MNKFLTVAVVAVLAITANQSQAVELVKAQPISVNTLTEDAKAIYIGPIKTSNANAATHTMFTMQSHYTVSRLGNGSTAALLNFEAASQFNCARFNALNACSNASQTIF